MDQEVKEALAGIVLGIWAGNDPMDYVEDESYELPDKAIEILVVKQEELVKFANEVMPELLADMIEEYLEGPKYIKL